MGTSRWPWYLALIALAIFLLASSAFTVDPRQRVLLLRFGEIRGQDYEPGLHGKWPLIDDVRKFDGRVLTLDSGVENFLTQEKKNLRVDFFVKWRIANVLTYYRATQGEDLVAQDRLTAIVKRSLLDEFGKRTVQQAISSPPEDLARALNTASSAEITALGIQLVDVRIKSVELTEDVRDSVYERMRAERTRVASELRAQGAEEGERIRAEADRQAQTLVADTYRQAEKIRGEGDAKAAQIYAKAYNQDPEFYAFYRSLQAYRDALKDKQDVLVLEPRGEFFKYFNGEKK